MVLYSTELLLSNYLPASTESELVIISNPDLQNRNTSELSVHLPHDPDMFYKGFYFSQVASLGLFGVPRGQIPKHRSVYKSRADGVKTYTRLYCVAGDLKTYRIVECIPDLREHVR